MQRLGILGVGELTEKVVRGLRRSGFDGPINLSPRNESRAIALSEDFSCAVMADNQAVVESSDILILGVRPDAVEALAREVNVASGKAIISLVAGMKLQTLIRFFPAAVIVRAMLSYAAEINSTTTIIYPANTAVERCLAGLGTTIFLEDEEAFDLATVAACMNGWFYFWLDDLQQWFIEQGLARDKAKQLVLGNLQDCLASARHKPQASLRSIGRTIATPGTYTSMGVDMLEADDVNFAWRKACGAVLRALKDDSNPPST